MRIAVPKGRLKIGEALPWDLYTADGRRIFRQGFVFRNKESLSRILGLELFFEDKRPASKTNQQETESLVETEERRRLVIYEFSDNREELEQQIGTSIFHLIDYCISAEENICESVTNGATDQLGNIESLVSDIIHAFTTYPDACIAAVHMDYEHHLSSMQPVYTAFLCLLMAEGLNLSLEKRHMLVGAALTANLGMFKHFDYLINRSTRLDEEEEAFVRAHPEASHHMLTNNHLTDEIWLNAVLQHHERGDGKGYPKGLTCEEIIIEASILATVDTYIAMVMPRAYRKALPPKVAMQQIYRTAVAEGDMISIGLIKQLGVYPPGTLVRLANQEIAMVVERNRQDSTEPKVAAIGHSHERIYSTYIMRQSNSLSYQILDIYQSDKPVEVDMNKIWQCDKPIFLSQLSRE